MSDLLTRLRAFGTELCDEAAAAIERLQRELGECSGALESVGHPIEWERKLEAARAEMRERCQKVCEDRARSMEHEREGGWSVADACADDISWLPTAAP